MTSKTDDFSSGLPMSHDDIAQTLTGSLAGVDATRAARFNELSQVRNAKSRSLAREQALLAQKHGTAALPRIAQAQQRFAAGERLRREIAVMTELAETPLPEADPDQLIVHGFVRRRSDRVGIPGLTLALTDRDGNWLRELGYACTDERGYFLLDPMLRESQAAEAGAEAGDIKTGINVEEAKREAEARREAQTKAESAQSGAHAAGDASTGRFAKWDSKGVAYLRVFDAKGHVLHTEARPVQVEGGNVDYRTILLGDDAAECGCVPPPAKAGGRPARTGPTPESPRSPALPPKPARTATQPRVAGLKSYAAPDPDEVARRNQPLEAIRGIGPKSADKLRRAGIEDVGDFERRRGEEFVKLAGFDKTPPRSQQPAAKPAPSAAPAQTSRGAESTPPAKAAPKAKQPAAAEPPAKRARKKN
jgi:hypothetical protein